MRPNFDRDQNLDEDIFLSPEGAETPGQCFRNDKDSEQNLSGICGEVAE